VVSIVISPTKVNELQTPAAKILTDAGITFKKLGSGELKIFARAFERQFVLAYKEREIRDLFIRHMVEILAGAMVAKEQMGADIDGEMPRSNQIGMCTTRAIFLGIGDDWEDAGSWTTGSAQNWIHSGTTRMGGTDGNAIKIGENQVTVLIAYGSLHLSPKIETVYYELDGKPKSVIVTSLQSKLSGLRFKDLDQSIFLYEDKEFLAQVFISSTFGTTVADYPFFYGVSYIKEPQLRIQLPSTLPGTTHKVVLTT